MTTAAYTPATLWRRLAAIFYDLLLLFDVWDIGRRRGEEP